MSEVRKVVMRSIPLVIWRGKAHTYREYKVLDVDEALLRHSTLVISDAVGYVTQ